MGFRINTNVTALKSQRHLSASSAALAKALERLSSGSRINRAGDDAAGLAVSEGLRSQVRGLQQAIRNANDGVGFLNTAEGALGESTNILQRVRELAIQSANGTISANDRGNLNDEVQALLEEFDRIATSTEFNGVFLLDGTFSTTELQVGIRKGQTIEFSIGNARASQVGSLAVQSGGQNMLSAATSNLVINNIAIPTSTASDDTVSTSGNAYSAIAIAKQINDKSGSTGVRAEVQNTVVKAYALDFSSFTSLSTGDFQINNVDLTGAVPNVSSFIDLVNEKSNQTGVKARFQTGSATNIEFYATDGRNIEFNFSGAYYTSTASVSQFTNSFLSVFSAANNYTTAAVFGATAQTLSVDFTGLHTGAIKLRSADVITVAGSGVSTAIGFAAGSIGIDTSISVSTIDVGTKEGAGNALAIVDAALTTLTNLRAALGAVQNRLDSNVANLSISSENLSSAQSQIRDADLAVETAELTKNQILQQAGVAVLTQANSAAQTALRLLNFQ